MERATTYHPLSPLQPVKRPWYRPFENPKYGQLRHHSKGEIVTEDCESGGCRDFHSLDKTDNESDQSNMTMTMLSLFTFFLPRCFADRVYRRIRQEDGQQREWVIGVLLCALCAFIVLLMNITLTIVAVVISYSKLGGHGFTSSVLYNGSCTGSKNWARGLHLVINILSTILLAVSNYCMQCLCSPSRQDVENAHAQGKWLDIGVASLRNLRFVGWSRCMLWALLLISSLPIHFVYNSAVFSALGTHEYGILLASSDFDFNNPPNDGSDYADCSEQNFNMNLTAFYSEVSKFEILDKQKCIDTYDSDYISDRGTVVLVTDNMTADSGSLRWVGMGNSPQNYSSNSFSWMCERDPNYPQITYNYTDNQKDCHEYPCSEKCLNDRCRAQCLDGWSVSSMSWSAPLLSVTIPLDDSYNVNPDGITPRPSYFVSGDEHEDLWNLLDFLRRYPQENDLQQYISNATHWKNSSWATDFRIQNTGTACAFETLNSSSPALSVDHCLSQKVEEKCQLLFSLPICLTVILCNTVKIACMLMAAHDDRKEIFLRVGDAVSSFLTRPDPTTENRCLWSKKDITIFGPKYLKSIIDLKRKSPQPAVFQNKRERWRRVTGGTNLGLMVSGYPFLLLMSLAFIGLTFPGLKNQGESTTFSGLWNMGFGSVSSSTVISPSNGSGTIPMVLLANAPQVAVSIAYYLCNNMLTVMSLAVEFNGYATNRKPLRVSWPKGLQRSTYYLSLPYRYGIPLLISHTILHWLVSQSLFLVDVTLFDMAGNVTPERLIACGYSPMAIIFATILISLLLFLVLGLRYKHFRASMPLAGSCSEIISAACHPPPGGGDPLKPVMWGEIPMSKATHTDTGTGSVQEHNGETTECTVSGLDSNSFSTDAETLNNNHHHHHQGQGNESQTDFRGYSNSADEGEALFHTVSLSDTTRGGGANEGGSNNAHLQCEEDGPAHCSFSSLEVITPSVGKSYL